MNLEVKHLVPYFPFELKILFKAHKEFIGTLVSMDSSFGGNVNDPDLSIRGKEKTIEVFLSDNNKPSDERLIRPILRPLSDITLELVQQLFGFEIEQFRMESDNENDFSLEVLTDLGWTSLTFNEYQNLLAYHFDLFMLIEKGLAVDINTLSEE